MKKTRFNFSKSRIEELRPHATKRLHFRDTNIEGLGLRLQPCRPERYLWHRRHSGGSQSARRSTSWSSVGRRFRNSLGLQWIRVRFRRDRQCSGYRGCWDCGSNSERPLEIRYSPPTVDLGLWRQPRRPPRRAAARSHYAANRTLQLLRAIFNWALDAALYSGTNPASRVKLFHEASRERFLQPEELPLLFGALDKTTNVDLRDFVVLALLTGARRGNLLAMRWAELDLERGLWAIPNTKNRQAHIVPLVARAMDLLSARRARAAGGDKTPRSSWVFASTGGTGHVVSFKRGWRRLLADAKLDEKGKGRLRIHDLRRSLGAWAAGENVSLHLVSRMVGYENVAGLARAAGITSVYPRLSVDALRGAIDKATTAMFAAGEKPAQTKLLEAGRE